MAFVAAPASAAASGTTTLHFYSTSQTLTATSATGQPLPPEPLFATGDHFDGTDLLYTGTHQRHGASFSGSDHLACVVTVASTTAERQTCNEQFALGSAMLLSKNVTVTFKGRVGSIPINGGTGRYKNARGTLISTPVGDTNDADNTLTLTGVASSPTAVPLNASSTLRFFSVQQTLQFTSAQGQPLRDVNATNIGDSYDTTDLYFAGTQARHASRFSASDHLSCTFTANDTQTCNSQIAIGGSLLLLTSATETAASETTVTGPITGGTGNFANARGTFQTGSNTKSTDITITLTS
jgi:hypothetical protein